MLPQKGFLNLLEQVLIRKGGSHSISLSSPSGLSSHDACGQLFFFSLGWQPSLVKDSQGKL